MSTLSRVGEIVRRADPDRFLTSLFAPPDRREALWLLYAFNHELARACETVREPMMALIRLQWWREVVEGATRRHEVAEPLGVALAAGNLDRASLLTLIEAREGDAPTTPEEWRGFVEATAGELATAAARALGSEDCPAIRAAGAAYGAAGVLRNRALAGEAEVAGLREAGLGWLGEARLRWVERRVRAAVLPAVLAARDLRRSAPVRERGVGDRLAVLRAALTGQL